MVLVRPDDHVAAIQPMSPGVAQSAYRAAVGIAAPGGGSGVTISVSYRFDDAVILITGAGSGIGAALARHCAREGATVIAVDRRHDPLLEGWIRLRSRIDVRNVDVSNEIAVAALIDGVRRNIPGSMPPCSAPPSSIAPISTR